MIQVRHVRFRWGEMPLHWIPDDAHTTKVIDVLHLLLPAGERWMVRVMKKAMPYVANDHLRDEMDGFLRQEGWHGRSHAQVVERWKELGIDVTRFTREIDWLFDTLLADRPLGMRVPARLEKRWIGARMALVAAIEHYTAALAEFALDRGFLAGTDADPTMISLLKWHAAEEIEHGHVAFDASVALGVGGLQRRAAFALVTLMLWYEWIRGVRFLAKADPSSTVRASWREVFRAGRQGRLPRMRELLRHTVSYYKPFYHPSKQVSIDLARGVLMSLAS